MGLAGKPVLLLLEEGDKGEAPESVIWS